MPFTLDTKKSVALAVATQMIVIYATLLLLGDDAAGAKLAARNTARTAALFFALALALRSQPLAGRSSMYGFVAAHASHFASVIYFSVVSPRAPLHTLNLRSAMSAAAGSTLLGTLALTVSAETTWAKRVNAFTTFLFGLVFKVSTLYNGLGLHAYMWGSAVPSPFLVAAIAWHFRKRHDPQRARAAAAS